MHRPGGVWAHFRCSKTGPNHNTTNTMFHRWVKVPMLECTVFLSPNIHNTLLYITTFIAWLMPTGLRCMQKSFCNCILVPPGGYRSIKQLCTVCACAPVLMSANRTPPASLHSFDFLISVVQPVWCYFALVFDHIFLLQSNLIKHFRN